VGEFQRIAQTLLIAAGLAPESLLVRDAAQAGWKRGLDATSGVVCDAVTALELPPGVFRCASLCSTRRRWPGCASRKKASLPRHRSLRLLLCQLRVTQVPRFWAPGIA